MLKTNSELFLLRYMSMFHSFNCDVILCLVIDIMPSYWSTFTVRTSQIFNGIYSHGKANIFKCKHIRNQPVTFESFTLMV